MIALILMKRPLFTRAPSTGPNAPTPKDSQRHIKVIKGFNSADYVLRFGLPPDCDSHRP